MLLFVYHIVFAKSKHRLGKVMILISHVSARAPNETKAILVTATYRPILGHRV